jgi:hypothetical protein
MFARGIEVLALTAALAAAQNVYRQPAGLYSLPLPQGWKVSSTTPQGDVHLLGPGNGAFFGVSYYAKLDEAPDAIDAYKQRLLAKTIPAHKLLKTANVQVDGAPATAEIYSGFMPDVKVYAVFRFVTVHAGKAGFVMMQETETKDWDRWKADLGVIEHGLRFARVEPDGSFTPVQQ